MITNMHKSQNEIYLENSVLKYGNTPLNRIIQDKICLTLQKHKPDSTSNIPYCTFLLYHPCSVSQAGLSYEISMSQFLLHVTHSTYNCSYNFNYTVNFCCIWSPLIYQLQLVCPMLYIKLIKLKFIEIKNLTKIWHIFTAIINEFIEKMVIIARGTLVIDVSLRASSTTHCKYLL